MLLLSAATNTYRYTSTCNNFSRCQIFINLGNQMPLILEAVYMNEFLKSKHIWPVLHKQVWHAEHTCMEQFTKSNNMKFHFSQQSCLGQPNNVSVVSHNTLCVMLTTTCKSKRLFSDSKLHTTYRQLPPVTRAIRYTLWCHVTYEHVYILIHQSC